MHFPYGLSDFNKLIEQDYWYLNRTDRIADIEAAGDQLILLRPRAVLGAGGNFIRDRLWNDQAGCQPINKLKLVDFAQQNQGRCVDHPGLFKIKGARIEFFSCCLC